MATKMNDICKVCLENTNISIEISCMEGKNLDIATILSTHLPKIFTEPPAEGLVCQSCWSKLNSFHEFYNIIEAVHISNLDHIDVFVKAEPLDILDEEDTKERLLEQVFDTFDNFSEPRDDLSEADFSESTTITSETEPTRKKAKVKENDDGIKPQKSKKCEECRKTFSSESLWEKHKRQAHPLPHKCKCIRCDYSFATEEELNQHCVDLHTREKCPQCTVVMYKHCIPEHIEKMHKPELCDLCGATCKNKAGLKNHQNTYHKLDPVKCDKCDKKFDNKRLLNDHKQIQHRRFYGNVDCSTCGKSVRNAHLAEHMKLHTEEGRRRCICDTCGKGFPRKAALLEHTTIHTGINNRKCSACGKTFRFSASLYVHRKKCF